MNRNIIITSVRQGFALCLALIGLFVVFEPTIGVGATTATSQFTISQTVNAEVSFSTLASNVTLAPSLGGLTGGDATGTTQVVVVTNDHSGYQMTITASSSLGMLGNRNSANTIPAYTPATPDVPDYNFTVPVNKAYFGYNVEASTSADLVASFKNNGTACNTGSSSGLNHCWLNASTTAVTIINTTASTAASGSTSTLAFHVKIQANPSPIIPDDTYVATTTLTATAN